MSTLLFSQNSKEAICGNTTSPKSIEFYNSLKPQLEAFKNNFYAAKLASKGTIPTSVINSIPVKVYIVRNSDGSGGLNANELNDTFNNLNSIYKEAFLEFFICDGVEYINDDALCSFKKGNESNFIENNYVPGLINMYFINNIKNESNESICGYSDNVGRNDMVFMNNDCALNGSSLPHEIGHFFSLLHTHGPDNNSTELVDGSNCDTDGDGICDTPADPGLSYTTVDKACNYTGTKTDAHGDTYTPDTSNIMSYSRKECRTFFSEEQLARMYAFYMTSKSYLACPSFNANIAVNENETCEESLTVNFESISDNISTWQWDVNNDGIIDYTTKNPTHTFKSGIYDITLTVSKKNKTIKKTYKNFIKVGTHTNKLDEDFENFNLLDNHGWTSKDLSGNGYNWYSNFGDTQSKETGPSNYKNAQNHLNTYMYAEASGAQQGDVATFTSPCINVNYQNSELEFSYHMFGKNIGELHVDIKTDSGFINDVIEPLYGNQQNNQNDNFITTTVNLSSYTNQTIQIRFRAVRGSSWKGDIAIDNVFLNTIHTPITNVRYTIYPNPIKNNLLYIMDNDEDTTSSYMITNLVGQPFLSGTVTSNPIDLSHLSSGTYLLILNQGKSRVMKKIIK
ncbi:T9SS type A sorting domain-containing protein [Algibacter sp. PT7-4]|uniref:T9SS type A sorting domain-containing protein n=1 Tax=Algibacter ulvanivorans TaxID=3400999 RepID=UPI003AB1023F